MQQEMPYVSSLGIMCQIEYSLSKYRMTLPLKDNGQQLDIFHGQKKTRRPMPGTGTLLHMLHTPFELYPHTQLTKSSLAFCE